MSNSLALVTAAVVALVVAVVFVSIGATIAIVTAH